MMILRVLMWEDGKGKLQTGVPKVPMEFDAKLQIG